MLTLTSNQRWWLIGVAMLAALALWQYAGRGPAATPAEPEPEGEPLAAGQSHTFTPGRGAIVRVQGIAGSVSIKTGRAGEVQVDRLAPRVAGAQNLDLNGDTLPMWMEGQQVVFGRTLRNSGQFGALPSMSRRPAVADLRLVVGDDAAVELLDFTGRATVTAVQGGVTLRGGKVQANLTNLGDGGLQVDVQSGQVSVDGAGGACTLALGEATLSASQLSCADLTAESRGDLAVQDANALGNVRLMSTAGSVSLARIRADRVTARSERGAVSLTDATVDGPLEIASKSGGVYLTRLGVDSLAASAESGTVELEDVRGALDVTAAGEVLLRRITAASLRVAGGKGDVQLSGTLLDRGAHEIRTKGGAVTVYLPKEASFTLDADSGRGGIIADPAFELPPGRNRLQERVHGGLVPLTIVSGGGAVKLLTGLPVF